MTVPTAPDVAAALRAALPDADRTDTPTITRGGDDDRRSRSQASRLVDLALDAGSEPWHDPAGDPYITVPVAGHREHHRLTTRPVRDWLARRYHDATGTAPGSQAIHDALAVLGGIARYEGAEHPVAVRVAGRDGRIYIDLGDPTWSAVAVDATGWRIEPHPPVRFVRSRGMLALPIPTHGGQVDALRDLLHVASEDDWRLIVGWLIGALRDTGPYPLLALPVEQGAGKSTAARLIRRLVDPHIAELRAEPRTIDDVMVAAARSRVIALDNLSGIPPWLSDALCRLSTGGALTKRELYTDADEIILEAVRPVIVTSITDVITRGDLLDRAIVVTLPALRDRERRDEAEVWARYAQVAPGILGALLDAVAGALARLHATRLAAPPRMADWARWVTAAEPALRWPAGRIVAAYGASREQAVIETIAGDPVAVAIRAVPRPWSGTASELLRRITPEGRPPRGWPESPRALSAALRRLAPLLRRVGIDVTYGRRPGGQRIISLEERCDSSSQPSQPSKSSQINTLGCDANGDGCDAKRRSPDFASQVPSHAKSLPANDLGDSDHAGDGCDGPARLCSDAGAAEDDSYAV